MASRSDKHSLLQVDFLSSDDGYESSWGVIIPLIPLKLREWVEGVEWVGG